MGVLPDFKEIVDLIKKGSTMEAQEAVMKYREEILDRRNEVIQLKKENEELKAKLDLRSKVKWEEPYYFIESEGERDGPFCQRCYDKTSSLIRLQKHEGVSGEWRCLECTNWFRDSSYREPPPPHRQSSRSF